jgi:hypothetical protein
MGFMVRLLFNFIGILASILLVCWSAVSQQPTSTFFVILGTILLILNLISLFINIDFRKRYIKPA